MSRPILVSAATLIVYINGERFGRITSFQHSAVTPHKELRGIDEVEAVELVPTTHAVRGTMGILRTKADGGLEGIGVTARPPQLARERYFSVSIIERSTDTVVFSADRCKVEDQNWSVSAKGLMMGQVSFRALTWNNEVRR